MNRMYIKMSSISLAILFTAIIFVAVLSGMVMQRVLFEEPSNSASTFDSGDIVYDSMRDFAEEKDTIIRATYVGTGDIIGMGNGIIQFPGTAPIDDTVYYLENIFEIEDVYKIENGLINISDRVTILECIGYGESADINNAVEKDGEYILFAINGQGKNYLVNPEIALQPVDNSEIKWTDSAKKAFSTQNIKSVEKFEQLIETVGGTTMTKIDSE